MNASKTGIGTGLSKCCRYSLLVSAFALFGAGLLIGNMDFSLVSLLLLFIGNVIYCFERIQSRILFLVFNVTTFVFLICRPIINLFRGRVWRDYTISGTWFALIALFITMVSLLAGAVLAESWLAAREKKKRTASPFRLPEGSLIRRRNREEFMRNLQIVALIFFYLTMFCSLMMEMEKLLFMRGREYEEYYIAFHTVMPAVIRILASMMVYFLCLFLSTKPSKKMAFIPLFIFVCLALPDLKIGIRNTIVLRAIFVFLYYFLRDAAANTKKWIGRAEKLFIAVAAPVAVVFLGAYNYIREGNSMGGMSLLDTFLDFFYKQGVSFNILCIAYDKIPRIESFGDKSYTFGGFIDYIQRGGLAELLFGASPLPNTNSIAAATQGHSFSHAMSYAALGDRYLEGHGYGSSFVLETYFDFGYLGVLLFSVAMGFLLIWFVTLFRKHWLGSTFVLISLTQIFLVPRASSTGFLEFLVALQFIVAMIIACLLSALCMKKYRCYSPEKDRGKQPGLPLHRQHGTA